MPGGKVTITRRAVGGDSRVVDSNVIASEGGSTSIHTEDGQDVEVLEEGVGGKAHVQGGEVRATRDHDLKINELSVGTESDEAEGAKGNVMSFGNGNTAVLMLAGAGSSSDVFKSDLNQMKDLLTSEHIGIDEEKIFTVFPRPKSKSTAIQLIKSEIEKIQRELEDSTDGFFVFFYSGHFGSDRKFILDEKGDMSKDHCLDVDLADLLMTIPAKYMLLILDMCHSALADVHAKDILGDGLGKQDSGPQEVLEPRLFEVLDKRLKSKDGDGASSSPGPGKVVQWSSSRSTEKSYNLQTSFFTKAIIDEITNTGSKLCTDVGSGNYASVLQVNLHVSPKVSENVGKYGEQQTPVINPKYAKEDYFKEYPYFAKIL